MPNDTESVDAPYRDSRDCTRCGGRAPLWIDARADVDAADWYCDDCRSDLDVAYCDDCRDLFAIAEAGGQAAYCADCIENHRCQREGCDGIALPFDWVQDCPRHADHEA